MVFKEKCMTESAKNRLMLKAIAIMLIVTAYLVTAIFTHA